jgi:unspecific monooxygenase
MLTHHLDLNDPAFIADPYPTLAQLREQTPVFYDPHWHHVFYTRYDDIVALLRDRRLGRQKPHTDGIGPPDPARAPFDHFEARHLMDREPPEHTRLKRLLSKAFTPQRVAGLRGTIERMVDRLLDTAAPAGRMDLLHDFAEPLPVMVIAELLGVPEADRHKLRPWSNAIVKLYELGYTAEQVRRGTQAVVEFSAYLRGLAGARRAYPQDDLISALVAAEDAGRRLTEDELIANCILLLNAGHEATVNSITSAMLALFRNPAQREQLLAAARSPGGAALFATAADELLRYDTPLPLFRRWVLEDMEHGGQLLKRGTEVALLYASGNRDPRRFERADELVLTRADNPHLTFGHGIHFCLGAPLGRLELQLALQGLLHRCPNIQLASDYVEYNAGFVIRGVTALPVAWNR